MSDITIITEDNVKVGPGDEVYNYYDMFKGVIEMRPDEVASAIAQNGDAKRDIWFRAVEYNAHGQFMRQSLLNGQRICSVSFAKRRGFKGA